MAGLIDLATQGAALFDRHAVVAPPTFLRWLWLCFRRLQLASLLCILARCLLVVSPVVTAAAYLATAVVPFVTTLLASLAIVLTGKRASTGNRQYDAQACPTDQIVTHFFLSGRCARRTKMAA